VTKLASTAAWLALLGCAHAPPATTPAPPLRLQLRGADVASETLDELRRLGSERVTVADPHENRDVELEGVSATKLFDAVFGPRWREAEDVVATCQDGFHPSIPVKTFLEHDAYVAFARYDSADFAIQETATKRTNVGPYYVVWKKSSGAAPPEPEWPFQVTALEVTDFATRFAAVIPPAGSTDLAREGFERFRTFCLPCHSINGRGGSSAPELNYPVSVTEYFAEPLLRQWIADPQRIRWGAKMPVPLPPGDGQARSIDAVVAYLKAMAGAKRAPAAP
jgi:mono/diheme cytochrome c family protein